MQFVCLAKSWKHGGRCVAGVVVEPSNSGGHKVVRSGEEPRWVRPVTNTNHGAVPEWMVKDICLLDIVELPSAPPCPAGYQSENVSYDSSLVSTVRKLPRESAVLDHFVTKREGPLFGNVRKAVRVDEILRIDHSLLLIKPADVSFHEAQTSQGKSQLRASFRYQRALYDLPVTDPEFVDDFRAGRAPAEPPKCYLTLSLGLPLNGEHYKLVAGVFAF